MSHSSKLSKNSSSHYWMAHLVTLLSLLNVIAESFRTKVAIIYGVTIALVNLGMHAAGTIVPSKCQRLRQNYNLVTNLSWKAGPNWFHNVVSGGTRSTTLGVDTPTQHNSPTYILYSYVQFSAYLLHPTYWLRYSLIQRQQSKGVNPFTLVTIFTQQFPCFFIALSPKVLWQHLQLSCHVP